MIKLIASALIVLSGGMAGLIAAHSYASRPQQLKTFRYALRMLETEISYGGTPLPEALLRIGNRTGGCIGEFFVAVSSLLNDKNGPSSGEAWEICLGDLEEEASLSPEDLDILRSFGYTLGISDREDQIKNLRLTQEQLKNQEANAEKLRESNQRMWKTLGFLGGLAVVFILY